MKKYLALIIVFLLMLVVGCKKVEPHLEVSFDSVEIIEGNVKLEYGDTVKLNALYKPGDIIEGIEIKKSDDDLVLLITENGLITAVGIGNSRLEISYINDKNVEFKEEINVEVVERVNKIERILISSKNVVPVGNIFMATVNTFGSNSNEEIIFESSNTEIATIDPDGTVYGVSTGECEIFAYVKGNESLKDKMTIHVIDVNTETEADRAKYRVIDSSSYKTLPYGIEFKKVSALTSTPLSGIDVDGYSGITQTIVANQYYSQQVSLLEIPRTSEVKITSWANLGNHKWSLTTVKGLINNYEKNNPGWKVVAAINGDFFDINANGNLPYQTSGPVVSNGEFYKTSGSWMVGFSNDGSTNTLIGGEPITRTEYMILAIYDDNGNIIKEFDIEKSFPSMKILYGQESVICKILKRIRIAYENRKPLAAVWEEIGEELKVEEIREFARVYYISGEKSGNVAVVMEKTASQIAEKMDTEKEIQVMLSEKRLEQKIMNLMPFLIMAYIMLSSPGYFNGLYGTVTGVVIMSICLGIYLLSYRASLKIVDIHL